MATTNRSLSHIEAVRMRERLLLNTPVCLVVDAPGKIQLVTARFRDVSDDGVAIFAGVELPIESEVQVEFTPPFGNGPLRVRAVVRNRRGYVYGLEFRPTNPVEEQTLQTLKNMLVPIGTKTSSSLDSRRWT